MAATKQLELYRKLQSAKTLDLDEAEELLALLNESIAYWEAQEANQRALGTVRAVAGTFVENNLAIISQVQQLHPQLARAH